MADANPAKADGEESKAIGKKSEAESERHQADGDRHKADGKKSKADEKEPEADDERQEADGEKSEAAQVQKTARDADTQGAGHAKSLPTTLCTGRKTNAMSNGILPPRDAEAVAWGTRFNTVASEHLVELGLSATEMGAFANAATALQAAMTAMELLRGQMGNATSNKNDARALLAQMAGMLNSRIQGKAGVSDGLKRELGLNVRAAATRRPPVVPQNLQANGYETGINALRWNRSGNAQGTQFIVEAKTGPTGDWTYIATTTAARYDHVGQTPGVPVTYRVCACRADESSPYSNPATVYGPLAQASLTLLKAA